MPREVAGMLQSPLMTLPSPAQPLTPHTKHTSAPPAVRTQRAPASSPAEPAHNGSSPLAHLQYSSLHVHHSQPADAASAVPRHQAGAHLSLPRDITIQGSSCNQSQEVSARPHLHTTKSEPMHTDMTAHVGLRPQTMLSHMTTTGKGKRQDDSDRSGMIR